MTDKIVIDTNLFFDDANIIYKLYNGSNKILLPLEVLQELDIKKYDKDLSYSARNAIQAIRNFRLEYPEAIIFDSLDIENNNRPDDKILKSAIKHNAAIATNDLNMNIKAELLNLNSNFHENNLNNLFDPYNYININKFYSLPKGSEFTFNSEYFDSDYEKIIDIFSELSKNKLDKNYWWFIIINTETKNKFIIYANDPIKEKIIRIDDKPKYREINTDGTKIKAMDQYQICAIYVLQEAPHALITGRWGSGKTLLSSAHAINTCRKKTFITRAPIGINSKYDIGFLPGDLNEKMLDWLQGFMSSLYYIYSNTRNDNNGKGSTYDYVKDRIFPEKFEIMPMNSIQGLSLLDNDILIVDEAQLITIDYMSMILSRPSKNSKLILLGDIKQTYNVVKPSNSGLLKLLKILPHKHIAYVDLKNSYRSPLLEVADKLQEKNII